MRPGKPLRALLLCACVAAWGPRPARAEPAEFLPVRSAAYDEIEVLASRGLLDSLRIYTRPLVRVDVAHALVRARRLHPELERNLNYLRLEREFARELTDLGHPPEQRETGPLADWRGGDARFRIQSAGHVRGDYDERREAAHYRFRDETAVSTRMDLQVQPAFGEFVELGVTRIRGQRNLIDPLAVRTDLEIAALHADLTARVGSVTAALGYDSFRWGPGRRGTLLLADAAGPMGFVWLQGNVVGRVTGTTVSGILSSAENRMLAAHRLEIAATPWLNLGLAEAVRYSSTGIDLLYGLGAIPYTLIERIHFREASTPDSVRLLQRSNVMASADAVVRVSPNLTLYGELLIDDFTTENKAMPDRFGWQAGFRSDRPMGGGMIHFLAEYARVRNYTYSVYYGQNFVYRDRPLGYALGPDVQDVWVEAGYDLSKDWQLRWSGDFVNKGEGRLGEAWSPALGAVSSGLSGVVEERREVWGDLRWLPRDNVDLSAGLGYRRRENVDHVAGVTEHVLLARLAAELRY